MTVRTRRAATAAVLVLPLALAAANWNDGAGYGAGDYAQYLLHANALVEGRAYDDIGYIYTEKNPVVGPKAYPPGLPVLLAPLLLLKGASPAAIKCAMLVCLLGFVGLAGRYAGAREGPHVGFAVALFCGAHAPLIEVAVFPSSDLAFCVLLLAVMFLAEAPDRPSSLRLLGIAVAGSAAIAFRSIGIALVPALLLHAALRGRKDGWRFAWPAVACAATFAALNAWLPTASSYADQVATSPIELVRMNFEKLLHYRIGVVESLLYPFPWNGANDVYHLIALAVAAFGGWEFLRRSWRSFYVLFAVCYALLLVPYWIATVRFLWPVLPLIAIAFANGVRVLWHLSPSLTRRLSPDAAALALAAAIVLPASVLLAARDPLPSLEANPSAREVFEFLRARNRAAPVRAVFFNPRVLALETGVSAMPMVPGAPEDVVREMLAKGITHVVVGDLDVGATGAADVRRAVDASPTRFEPLARFGEFEVYRLRTDGSRANNRSSRPDG